MDFALCVVVADHLDASEIQLTQTKDFEYDFTYHVFKTNSDVKKCVYYNRISSQGWYVWSNVVVVFIKRVIGK